MDKRSIKAIAFDFGNTLCPWNEQQYWAIMRDVLSQVCAIAPGHDCDSAYEVYQRVRAEECARSLPQTRENDIAAMYTRTVLSLRGTPPDAGELRAIFDTQVKSFAGVCTAPDGLSELLARLSERYRLAVLSNYPVGDCIRESLRKMGIDRYFDAVVVSGDLGIIKPGRRIFEHLLSEVMLNPAQVLFVGDDWIADIVGACTSGIPCVHIGAVGTEENMSVLDGIFGPYFRQVLERPEFSKWQEAKPDAVVKSVFELERWLEESGA